MIYDCFTFFNELDLLEIRLNVLKDTVDKFVLVEATRTHQGKSKALFYEENKSRFSKFHAKIIHVILDEYPSFFSKWRNPRPWDLEKNQRNGISKGLGNCLPEDIIIVSDLDEIPDPVKIKEYVSVPGVKVFEMRNFYYYLNSVCTEQSEKYWLGSVMSSYKDFRKPQDLRNVGNKLRGEKMKILKDRNYRWRKSLLNPIFRNPISLIKNAGWHFSYLGGEDKIIQKLEAFAHTEYNTDSFKNKLAIKEAILSGKDIFARGFQYENIVLDESYPAYLLQHQDKYVHLIKKIE